MKTPMILDWSWGTVIIFIWKQMSQTVTIVNNIVLHRNGDTDFFLISFNQKRRVKRTNINQVVDDSRNFECFFLILMSCIAYLRTSIVVFSNDAPSKVSLGKLILYSWTDNICVQMYLTICIRLWLL